MQEFTLLDPKSKITWDDEYEYSKLSADLTKNLLLGMPLCFATDRFEYEWSFIPDDQIGSSKATMGQMMLFGKINTNIS